MFGYANACMKRRIQVVDWRFLNVEKFYFSALETPTVLFQDNHLLVVNKPVGWHSVPNAGPPSPKCLLSELKHMELGGGRLKDFLLSLHRIDQPCSGVMMFAKTGKAATRVTTLWKKKKVAKQYLCVVPRDRIESLMMHSHSMSSDWYSLKGVATPSMKNQRSVNIRPIDSQSSDSDKARQVSLNWKLLKTSKIKPKFHMILAKTNDGSRHMVRALLAQVGGCAIQGDIRYNMAAVPLSDQSVALHAFRLSLDPSIELGTLKTFDFEAPIPKTWEHFFGIVDVAAC